MAEGGEKQEKSHKCPSLYFPFPLFWFVDTRKIQWQYDCLSTIDPAPALAYSSASDFPSLSSQHRARRGIWSLFYLTCVPVWGPFEEVLISSRISLPAADRCVIPPALLLKRPNHYCIPVYCYMDLMGNQAVSKPPYLYFILCVTSERFSLCSCRICPPLSQTSHWRGRGVLEAVWVAKQWNVI